MQAALDKEVIACRSYLERVVPMTKETRARFWNNHKEPYYKYRIGKYNFDIVDDICCMIWVYLENFFIKSKDYEIAFEYTKLLGDKLNINPYKIKDMQKQCIYY